MAVEGGAVEVEVVAQGGQDLAIGQQEADGADIAVVGAPTQQRHPVDVGRRGWRAGLDELEHEVGPAGGDPLDQWLWAHRHHHRWSAARVRPAPGRSLPGAPGCG
jgi:hypothetical protein